MKLFSVFIKTLREMSRDLWLLGLTLAFAPFFVFLYWIWFYGGSTSYAVLVINYDRGTVLSGGAIYNAGEEVVREIERVAYPDGKPLLKVKLVASQAEAEPILKNRGATAFIEIPEDFSQVLESLQSGDRSATTKITFGGDLSNPYYTIGATLALTAADKYVQQMTGQMPLVGYDELPLGASAARTEFETYVPGTLIFSVILLVFLASMVVAREIESGTVRRLQITRMTAFDLLGGITLSLVLVGAAGVAISFGLAAVLGFRSQGPIWVAILVGAVASLSVIGVGMVVACFSRSVSHAFVVANFPLGLMMFFSGVVFPLPKVTIFTLGGHAVGLYDLLPPTHAVVALNKILTLGAGFDEVVYELTALVVLSVLYFFIGVWLFRRMHLRVA